MRLSAVLLLGSALVLACGRGTPRDPHAGVPPNPSPPEPGPVSFPAPSRPGEPPVQGGSKVDDRFVGRITEVSFGCGVDASCNMVVDGTKYVHFGHDTRGEPPSEWGNADSLWEAQRSGGSCVGRTVEVFAGTTDHVSYSIQGKSAYYIRVLGP